MTLWSTLSYAADKYISNMMMIHSRFNTIFTIQKPYIIFPKGTILQNISFVIL